MTERKRPSPTAAHRSTEGIFHLIFILLSLCCLLPPLLLILVSFTDISAFRSSGFSFFPSTMSLSTWSSFFTSYAWMIGRVLFNSIFYTLTGTLLGTLMSILYAYALYRVDFRYRSFFTKLCLFPLLFSVSLPATYMIYTKILGLTDNYAAMIVPLLVSPACVFIMRAYYRSLVPQELVEASSLDGCSEYGTFFRIVAPAAKPGITTIALFTALSYWNDWFTPMLYIRSNQGLYNLQGLLQKMMRHRDELVRHWSFMEPSIAAVKLAAKLPLIISALCVLAFLPVMIALPALRRRVDAVVRLGPFKG